MLMFILQWGRTEIMVLLLKMPGIDVNASDNHGNTPLSWAASVSYNYTKHINSAIYKYFRTLFCISVISPLKK